MESVRQFLTTPQTAAELAVKIHGETGKASDVNPILYKMLSQKLVTKSEDPRPVWSLLPDIRGQILQFLTQQGKEIPTLTIAKQVMGLNAKAKDINPYLYAMEKEGRIQKMAEADGTKPRWMVRSIAREEGNVSIPY